LQENKESPKPALHALIERIAAYPDRKKEVNFRIGEKGERNSWGTRSVPPRVAIPRRGTRPWGDNAITLGLGCGR
jgi:hypothetical protein